MIRTLTITTILLAATVVSSAVAGQVNTPRDDRERARLLGALVATRLSVRLEDVPAREAFAALSRAVGVPIRGRFLDDRIGHGIDPEVPIFLDVAESDGLEILELMVEQCEEYAPCTWQLRSGYVEVGTKERLAAPSSVETRTIQVRDLLLEPPYFVAPSLDELARGGGGRGFGPAPGVQPITNFYDHKYSTAVVSAPVEVLPANKGWEARKRPEELVNEIVQAIVEVVEPGNWDYGQFEEPAGPDDVPRSARRGSGANVPSPQRRLADAKVARIRVLRDRVVIRAPDYVHRQVAGYPPPLPPPPLGAEERERRSTEASATNGCEIHVLSDRGGSPVRRWGEGGAR